ncbi:MAG: chromate transporter [Firmicutes bacterium]|nr:chromate transporter [Bacillota bacterium]
MKEIFRMFTGFFKIGMFTFGGGLAMLPLIQKMAVDDYKWLTEEEMVDCVAVTQAMPGVIAINTATYIGYKRRGFAGALFSTLGVILPSFMIIICAVLLLSTIGENKYVDSAFTAITASSCALIMYSAIKLGKQVIKGAFGAVLAALSLFLVGILEVGVVPVIIGGGIAGIIYAGMNSKRIKEKTEKGDE